MKELAAGLLAVVLVACMAVAQKDAPQSTTVSGWITDAKCAARAGADLSNAACAKKCAKAGEKLVFVSDKDKKILHVNNQDAVKGHEGHHVSVIGQVNGDTLHVDKVSMLEER